MNRSDLITEAERRLWDAFPRGEEVVLGDGDPTEGGFDPDTWGEDRCIRGEVIIRLLLGAQPRQDGYVARVALPRGTDQALRAVGRLLPQHRPRA